MTQDRNATGEWKPVMARNPSMYIAKAVIGLIVNARRYSETLPRSTMLGAIIGLNVNLTDTLLISHEVRNPPSD